MDKTQKILNKLTNHKVTPIAHEMVIPNHSGVRKFIDTKTNAFGEIWVMANATADTIATATNAQVTRFANNGESLNSTPDHTNDHIIVGLTGRYKVTVSISFKGDASVEWDFRLYTNNGTTAFSNVHCDRKLGSGGDVGSAGMSGICSFNDGDTVEVWMKHEAGVNKAITVEDITLSIHYLGR